jgi:hypothetical protein
MSSLLLEKNGRISSSKQTKHIKAKNFLIKDYYKLGEIDLCYCPTDVMWADVLTKPLQEQKFRDMGAFLQNCPWDYDDDIELNIDQLAQKLMNQLVKTVASSQECVDGHAKLRTKQRSQEPSQPRGQPPAMCPTRVSRVTWGPSQVLRIQQRIPQRIPPGCPRDPTKNRQRIGDDPWQFRK